MLNKIRIYTTEELKKKYNLSCWFSLFFGFFWVFCVGLAVLTGMTVLYLHAIIFLLLLIDSSQDQYYIKTMLEIRRQKENPFLRSK